MLRFNVLISRTDTIIPSTTNWDAVQPFGLSTMALLLWYVLDRLTALLHRLTLHIDDGYIRVVQKLDHRRRSTSTSGVHRSTDRKPQ